MSEREALCTGHAALNAGPNLFDTADSYEQGRSEILLGKALTGRRHEVYVATKVGKLGRPPPRRPAGLKSRGAAA